MADNQYPDLGITQKQDGEYWDIVIPDLDLLTTYGAQFAWVYKDKDLGVSEYSDVFEFTTPGAVRTCPINVNASWDTAANLTISFEKPFLPDGVTRDNNIKLFQITLTAAGQEPLFSTVAAKETVNTYKFTLSQQDNMANFVNVFQTTLVGKITSIYGDGSSNDCLFDVPVYVDPVCVANTAKPTVTGIDNGILVSWQDPTTGFGTYRESRVYVSETNNPYLWELKYTGFGPASITLDTLNTVYVKLNHLSDSGCESIDSEIATGKAFDTIEFDNTPPDPVTNASGVWSGQDLIVSFTMPTDAKKLPSYVKVHLASSGSTEYFEKTVAGISAGVTTSVKITRNEFIDGFGFTPLTFSSGYITDLDIYRNENTTQVSIANILTITKPNPLADKTTVISVTGSANGYIVSSNLDSKATGIEIYQSNTENGTYTLVASSNVSPVIVYDEDNAGNDVWVKAEWTSENGNAARSIAHKVSILDVGALSLIENPVKIATDGSIFAGTLDANNDPVLAQARMVINKRGLFLYDDNDENGTAPTTQIIGKWDADNSLAPATFITKKAKIANWIISENQFENVITSGTNIFTGISPNGTYAFWAGAGVTGGYSSDINKDAKFSVTKEGKLVARDIKVLGGEIQVGSKFKVDTQGKVEATDVKLSGEIKAASGILGNVEIGGTIDGVTYSGQLLVDAANGSKVEIGKYTSGDITNPQVGFSGIQVTGANGKYVQLDPVNGIIANKGTIAGWTLAKEYSGQTLIGSSINYANNVGFFAPIGTPSANDIMIWAGTSRTGSPGPNFQVTYSGALTATEATIKGSIEAREGYFGKYSTITKTITEGWKINGKFLQSFSDQFNDVKVKLDGLQGTIAGGNIVGSNMFFMNPDDWYTAYPNSGSGNPGNVDYISSSGNFSLANGKLTYDGDSFNVQTDLVASNIFLGSSESFSSDYLLGKNSTIGSITKNAGSFRLAGGLMTYENDVLTINPNKLGPSQFKLYLNAVTNGDGTAGDKTLVQDADTGEITLGRAFFYAGNNYPDGKTDRSQFSGGEQGTGAFDVGDVILSRKA